MCKYDCKTCQQVKKIPNERRMEENRQILPMTSSGCFMWSCHMKGLLLIVVERAKRAKPLSTLVEITPSTISKVIAYLAMDLIDWIQVQV